MVQTLSQQGFGTASPSGATGLNGTPAGMAGLGLGVDMMGTPGAMARTPSMGMGMGMGMVPSMSDLGLSLTASGGQKRNEDEERRAKMRRIIKKIGKPRGRVSEEGIARVGRRVGFENDIDSEILTAEEKERKVGNRLVSIAGDAVVVDVNMKDHVPTEVQVMLSGEIEGLNGMAEKAGEVLLERLKESDSLSGFAKGLDWIARIDRVGDKKINGFEALGGIFGSLTKLFREEVRMAEENGSGIRERAEAVVLYKRSGKPTAHERGGLGISLDYWQDDRSAALKKADKSAMDIDGDSSSAATTTPPGLHTLHLDLERCPPEIYPPIRISSTWLPETLNLQPNNPVPWQEPGPTFLATSNEDANMTDANQAPPQDRTLPSLRFLARLDPPIVLPWQTATALHTSLNASPPQAFPTPALLHHLLIPAAQTGTIEVEQEKTVLSRHDPESETEAKHVYRLHVARPEFGLSLEEVPFSHPKQIVESLPLLRQWGCFAALVQDLFPSAANPSAPLVTNGTAAHHADEDLATSLEAFLARQDINGNGEKDARLAIDVSLATSPAPTLSLAFPSRDGKRHVAVKIGVGLNGDVVVGGDVVDVEGSEERVIEGKKARRWARGLEVCGSVGVWVEWLRGEEGA